MALTDVYFGCWSARDIETVSQLLKSLGVRFEVIPEDGLEEDRLKAWHAWDESSNDRHKGFHLFIESDDLAIVDTKIVDLFPERK